MRSERDSKRRVHALACAALVSSSSCLAVGAAPVTPQRPTFSSDTSTTSPETFELEAGVGWDPSDALAAPLSLKYGVDSTTEVFANWAPYQYLRLEGEDEGGAGDVALGVRHRFVEETSGPSAALQATLKLPTADEGLGSDEVDASLAGILTKSLRGHTLVGFYQLDALGSPEGGADIGHGAALAISRGVGAQAGLFIELAGTAIPELDSEQLFTTAGATYQVSPSLVLDMAVVAGLSDEAPDFQLLIGFTHNFGTLFSSAPRP